MSVARPLNALASLVALALTLGVVAPVRADVVVPHGRVVPALVLTQVSLASSDAPASDASTLTDEVHDALLRQRRRLASCMAGVDLRTDPVAQRSRTLRGTLTFDRSTRPSVRFTGGRNFPSGARSCVAEAVNGLAVRQAPRGRVVVHFAYRIG